MSDLGADYREAKDSVAAHLAVQAAAELARAAAPSAEADAAVDKAVDDVEWCRGLVIACGEEFKGVAFEDVPNMTPVQVETAVGAQIQALMVAEREAEAGAG